MNKLLKKNKINTWVTVGSMWGDEGKGKITDYLSQTADLVVRFQGGNNAGHTVKVNGKGDFFFSIIPSGLFSSSSNCLISNGAIFNPSYLLAEISRFVEMGIDVFSRLKISSQAHLIMPFHIVVAHESERALGKNKLGSCLTGLRQANIDKVERIGIRVEDLVNRSTLKRKLKNNLEKSRAKFSSVLSSKELSKTDLLLGMSFNELLNECLKIGEIIAPLIEWNSSDYLIRTIKKNKKVIFEGAQATLLDIEHGTYPYCTSTDSWVGGVCKGAGISPYLIKEIVGVVRTYSARMDVGPFPSEIKGKPAQVLRKIGNDFGFNAEKNQFDRGTPSRVGWLDAVALRYSAQLNTFTQIAVTKLDVLDLFPKIKICKAYKYQSPHGNKIIHQFPTNLSVLNKCEPIYEEIEGWCQDTSKINKYKDLPKNAKKYLKIISKITDAPVSLVSVGPERGMTIKVPSI